jgi:hypothetical protein
MPTPADSSHPRAPRSRKEKRRVFLEKSAKRALRKASAKSKQPLTRIILGKLKIQTMPLWERLLALAAAFLAGWGAAASFEHDKPWFTGLLIVAAIILLLIAIFGVRRTLTEVADQLPGELADKLFDALFR